MNRSKRAFPILSVSLCILAACAAPATPAPAADIDQLNTIVAETAIGAKTQSAVPRTSTPSETMTSTSTFGPRPSTLTPTQTLMPTSIFSPTPPIPIISVSLATNCRNGPGKVYQYKGALLVGQVAQILAGEPTGKYWYIQNPGSPGEFCWIWGQYATIAGDTSGVPIYTPPPLPTLTLAPVATTTSPPHPTPAPASDIQISYTSVDDCATDWWVEFQLTNTGDFNLRSVTITVFDSDIHVTVSKKTDGFTDVNGCSTPITTDFVVPGNSVIVSGPEFAYDPSGHEIELTVTACSKIGQAGSCKKRKIEFVP